MDIKEFMSESLINVNLKGNTKKEIIEEMSLLFEKSGKINNLEEFRKALFGKRKYKLYSTRKWYSSTSL